MGINHESTINFRVSIFTRKTMVDPENIESCEKAVVLLFFGSLSMKLEKLSSKQ